MYPKIRYYIMEEKKTRGYSPRCQGCGRGDLKRAYIRVSISTIDELQRRVTKQRFKGIGWFCEYCGFFKGGDK